MMIFVLSGYKWLNLICIYYDKSYNFDVIEEDFGDFIVKFYISYFVLY